jgi:hypothetical protein
LIIFFFLLNFALVVVDLPACVADNGHCGRQAFPGASEQRGWGRGFWCGDGVE